MREYVENGMSNGPDKIDINDFLLDMARGIKKLKAVPQPMTVI